MQPLTLYELNSRVRQALSRALPDDCWVQAELSDVRVNAAGHCYVEFVQKDTRNHSLIAKSRGTIWGNVFRLLRPYFERETGQPFSAGIKVLVQVRVEFHELYGYSLTVTDIDPSYTVGDMVRRRREILRQLEEEGVLSLNKELPLAILPQRIAVISSPTAAGYGDFCNQLSSNPYGLQFYPTLIPAIMQGDRVEASVLDALDHIHASLDEWDAVVIIRGGGAVSDLSGFDTYLLAAACAQFPLPVITGIGHERDDTVLDMVAHTRVKTPTAAAEFLISRAHETALRLEALAESVQAWTADLLAKQRRRLADMVLRLPQMATFRIAHERERQTRLWGRLTSVTALMLQAKRHQLQLLAQRTDACDVGRILSKGFSLTTVNGRAVTDASALHEGDVMHTRVAKGTIVSEVKEIKEIV
ncbi:MAG: exodeoxyribonuclease VII large subunit [Bacteroidaceae bacterium]|nr:exodeoxyribonuclease VII large subunit [Bacteroidaceae bacterium]